MFSQRHVPPENLVQHLQWNLFKWWYQFDAYAPHTFSQGGKISAGGGFLGILFAVIGSVLRGRSAKALNTFGSV